MKRSSPAFFFMLIVAAVACKTNPQDSSPLLSYRTSGTTLEPVKTKSEWPRKRALILEGMEQAMGQLPSFEGLPPFDVNITDSVKEKLYTRYSIWITVAENERLPANLYIPAGAARDRKLPAMLTLHGTGDAGKELVDRNHPDTKRPLATDLADRGYVVIAPDYPSMGDLKDYDFESDRYASGTMKAIFNHMRCVDFLQSRQEVDPEKIGVIGHSLGGHNAMFVGAFDTRLKAIVASCGWTLMDYYDIGEEGTRRYGGRLGPWAQDRYMPWLREKYELDGHRFPFDFDAVIAALAPRLFFSNSPINDSNFDVEGVREGISSASAVYKFLDVPGNLQVRYPDAGHDFPVDVRLEAYRYLDKLFEHTPVKDTLEQHP
jgi:pimeloyl-ACP methyl ester carboxylesterase